MFPPAAVAKNFKDLKNDVATLARLQVELFQSELHDCGRNLRGPGAVCALAIIIALGSFPVLLLGLAESLAAWTVMPRYLCLEATGLAALMVAALASYYGWRGVNRAASAFHRSQDELRRNLKWLKESIGKDWGGASKTSNNSVVEEP